MKQKVIELIEGDLTYLAQRCKDGSSIDLRYPEPKQKWIPVEEEKPRDKEVVLLKTQDGYLFTGKYFSSLNIFVANGVHAGYEDEIAFWKRIEQ